MEVFDTIPFQPEFADFAARVHLSAIPDQEEGARRLMEQAAGILRPKALYTVSYIQGRTDDTVDLGTARFRSRVMSANLREVERIFPYVATCGTELDEAFAKTGAGEDLLAMFWLDCLKEMALFRAVEFLRRHLQETYRLDQLSSMNPGSGEADLWPLAQQKPLFSLLGDVKGLIGVTLTPSCLMTPNKSVSGIYFPAEVPFESCQHCTREACPRRRAPYQGVLPGR